jgi:hypothetical protein
LPAAISFARGHPKKRWLYPSAGGLIERQNRVDKVIRKAGKGTKTVVDPEQTLHSILLTLEQCRAHLVESANADTARLVAIAILDLRMKLNQIGQTELKALCDAMVRDQAQAETQEEVSPAADPQRPLLKLVK